VTRDGVAGITAANHWTSDIREYVPDYLECHWLSGRSPLSW